MDVNRRRILAGSAAGAAGALALPVDAAQATPLISTLGRDATQYGVKPNSPDDQTRALQRAIDEAARVQAPLALPPGTYRSSMLRLARGTQLVGVRGATKLVFTGGGPSLLSGEGADGAGIDGIPLDGGSIALPQRRGLLHLAAARDIRVIDCEIARSGGSGIWLEQVSGDVSGNLLTDIAVTAIVSFDALGLIVSRNTIKGTRDNGIEILRTAIGDDGTMVLDNTLLDLSKVKVPVYNLATREDHIAPADSVLYGSQFFGGPVKYVLSGSGHIAGVVNPPSSGKYQYWTNDQIHDISLKDWMKGAQEHKGSWWPDWRAWLAELDPEEVPARSVGNDAYPPIEDAPGSYVRVRA